MSRRTTAPLDRVVSTFWLSDRARAAGKPPITHVFGPYTAWQARKAKKAFDAEEAPEPGYHHVAVKKIIDVVDGVATEVVHMETRSREKDTE